MTTISIKQKKGLFVMGVCLAFLFLISINRSIASERDSLSADQVNLAVIWPGQTKTFTAESDTLYNIMIIPVIVVGPGTLNISVSKTDSVGELIGVMQTGNGHPASGYNVGITPRSLTLSSRFWWEYGMAVITSALLFTTEDGPHRYNVTLSY